jgi:hypothetical protein
MPYNEGRTNFNTSPDNKGAELIKKAKLAFSNTERVNVESLWQELAEFILPAQNGKFFGRKIDGTKRDQRIFDITGPTACRDLAAAMHSTITNPASKWSKLRFRETELNNLEVANAWTENAVNEVHNALSDSNFDQQIGACYQSLTALGTAILLHEEIEKDGVYAGQNFASLHLSEIAISENEYGVIDCLYRKFELTLKQAYAKFGDKIGSMKDGVDSRPEEKVEFYHCIYMRDRKDVDVSLGMAPADKRPIASDYVMVKGNVIVQSDGYYEFPVYAMRWITLPGECYGYGPGHIARADILTLNTVRRQLLKGLAKAVDPIILTEQNNLLTGDFRPGRQVSVRNLNGTKEMITQSRFDIGFMMEQNLQNAIKSAFYIDKLMLPPRTETGAMTAYEIQQRLEQMQVILGPPLSRLNTELLQPLVIRELGMLQRAGIIPPIPQEVVQQSKEPTKSNGTKDINYDVAFVNSLARSQQLSELRNITSYLEEVGQFAQIKPEALDILNTDAIVEKMARIRDIPEELTLPEEQVAATRQVRSQQAQQQQDLMGGEQVSNIMKNASQAQGGNIE